MNYNLDLSGSLNPVDKFSVEAKFDLGDSGRGETARKAEALYLEGVEEYANGNYAKAIAIWEEVLKLDPKYQPATEDIHTAQQTMALQDQLQGIGAK
jgi:tetratricopeptide (TPR) repeat protein